HGIDRASRHQDQLRRITPSALSKRLNEVKQTRDGIDLRIERPQEKDSFAATNLAQRPSECRRVRWIDFCRPKHPDIPASRFEERFNRPAGFAAFCIEQPSPERLSRGQALRRGTPAYGEEPVIELVALPKPASFQARYAHEHASVCISQGHVTLNSIAGN